MSSTIIHDRQKRGRRRLIYERSARTFLLISAVGIILAICLFFQENGAAISSHSLQERSITTLDSSDTSDDTCRRVRTAPDQCAFIKKHCPTDEAGFAAYLDLYYCQLSHVKPIAFIILVLWLGFLFTTIGIASSDFFCVDLSTMAQILGMSESLAGVTLLAFGNGSPDVFSTFAAMSTDSGDLAIGELMGAAGFITAVVAGSMALVKPFKVAKKSFIRDVGFFTVAAAFTMVILADGLLHLWECLAMIAFYLFYVGFVLFWHYFEIRRQQRAEIENAARGHYNAIGDTDDIEPYRDDPDAENGHPMVSRGASAEDFAALERATGPEDEDYDDEERDRWMSELNTNMRLSRPVTRPRSTTIAPVRPSLVGALEFSAVLQSMKKAGNQQHVQLNGRRYSDDPNLVLSQPNGRRIVHRRASVKDDSPVETRPQLHVDTAATSSQHAEVYSANTAPLRHVDSDLQWRGQGHSRNTSRHEDLSPRLIGIGERPHISIQAPSIEVTHHSPEAVPTQPGIDQSLDTQSRSRGRPADLQSSVSEDLFSHRKLLRDLNSPTLSPLGNKHPLLVLPSPPRSRSNTRTSHDGRSPRPAPSPRPTRSSTADSQGENATSFPSLALPPPVLSSSPERINPIDHSELPMPEFRRPTRWRFWPYKLIPAPEVLASVLFPTFSNWEQKNLSARVLAFVAAPSVFLLTLTLPVVEGDKVMLEEETSFADKVDTLTGPQSSSDDNILNSKPGNDEILHSTPAADTSDPSHPHLERVTSDITIVPAANEVQQATNAEYWPRWLLFIQLYTAPFVILMSIYLQSPELPPPSWLIRPSIICLLISTFLLIPVLLTTSPTYRPPAYRWILSLAGFAVSIAWISAIASQVVGALKAGAVILNMSNAIMGLTVFAVGNSVSDLVADVTVANLGFPVMALSACFGGPMLNILLGIGLSGTYSILRGADRRKHKHPKQGYKLKTFHLDVGRTLTVSGVSLLITLVALLILVPLNKWMLTRKIAAGLMILWLITTIANVVLEITGHADVSMFA